MARCVDETGRPIFLDLLRRKGPSFVAFDLLWLDGEDLRPLPLMERKAPLRRLLRRRANHLIAEAMSVEGRGTALFAAVEQHDLEGIVAKRKSDPYRTGVHWWKIKKLLNGAEHSLPRRKTTAMMRAIGTK